MSKESYHAIGVISGTSVDGIDVAHVEIFQKEPFPSLKLRAFKTYPYAPKIRTQIFAASSNEPFSVEALCRLNVEVGEVFAEAILAFSKEFQCPLKGIDLIGSHGQTIRHLPPSKLGKKTGATLQIGEPSVIAEKTGVLTIADFRPRDLAAGGNGAPLTPYLHYCLFHDLHRHAGVQNIGGMGNLTFIRSGVSLSEVVAFDTGPGNVLIDAAISLLTKGRKQFDTEGSWAAKGKVIEKLLHQLMAHPYIKKKIPKTTGREIFGIKMAKEILQGYKKFSPEDVLATLTAFTAHSIAHSCRWFPIEELIIGGGGVRNRTLFKMICSLLPTISVKSFEDYHLNSDAIEAMAFALLGYETVHGRVTNIPSVTGARYARVLGKVIPGNNFFKLSLN